MLPNSLPPKPTQLLKSARCLTNFHERLTCFVGVKLAINQLKTVLRCACLAAVLLSLSANAQQTRSLDGAITLDVGQIDRDLTLALTVNNHNFVVLPTFAFIRPITSSRTVTVDFLAGADQMEFTIDGIIENPVDYSIEIQCLGCSDSVPRQYFTQGGNLLGLVGAAFIDPDDLASSIDISLISRSQISGVIQLQTPQEAPQVADRDLSFVVDAVVPNAGGQAQQLLLSQTVMLSAGESQAAFILRGISRSTQPGVSLVARCQSCLGVLPRQIQSEQLFSALVDHTGVEFIFDSNATPTITGAIDLILENRD